MYYNNNNNITAAADEEWYLWLLTFARRRDSPLLSVPYFQQCQCRFVVKQTGIRINNKGEESGCAKKENKREHLQPFSPHPHPRMINQMKGNPVKCVVKAILGVSEGREGRETGKKWVLIPQRHINFRSIPPLLLLRMFQCFSQNSYYFICRPFIRSLCAAAVSEGPSHNVPKYLLSSKTFTDLRLQ